MKKLLAIALFLVTLSAYSQTVPLTPSFRGNTPVNSKDTIAYTYPGKIGGYSWLYNAEYIRTNFAKKDSALIKGKNLFDVPNKETARANLGIDSLVSYSRTIKIQPGSTTIGIGDSWMYGIDAGGRIGFFNTINSGWGTTGLNYGISGSGTASSARTVFINQPSILNKNITVIMSGHNNETNAGHTYASIEGLKGNYRSMFVNSFLKTASAASTLSTTGTWVTDTITISKSAISLAGTSMRSSVAGSTMTYSFTGSNASIMYFGADSSVNAGRFSVTVDGIAYNTIDENGKYKYVAGFDGGRTRGTNAYTIFGLRDTTHTLVITTLDNKVTYIDAIATLQARNVTPVTLVCEIMGNVPSEYTTLNTAVKQVIAEFTGYSVWWINTNKYFNVATDITLPETHPNNLGHGHIARAISEVVSRDQSLLRVDEVNRRVNIGEVPFVALPGLSVTETTPRVYFQGAGNLTTFPILRMQNASGSITLPQIISNGATLGEIRFGGQDGTNAFKEFATITARVTSATSAGTVPAGLGITTGSTSAIERLFIDESGNTVISNNSSTSSPVSAFEQRGSGNAPGGTTYTYGNNTRMQIYGDSTTTGIAFEIKQTNADIRFKENGVQTGRFGNKGLIIGNSLTHGSWLQSQAGTTTLSSLFIPEGVAKTSPTNGDMWADANYTMKWRSNGTSLRFLFGNAIPTNTQVPVGNASGYFTMTTPTGTGTPVFSASPTLTGTPLAPTAGSNINTTQIVNGAWVNTYYTPLTRTLTGGNGINSIGDLSSNRTISADTTTLRTVLNSWSKSQADARYARLLFDNTYTGVNKYTADSQSPDGMGIVHVTRSGGVGTKKAYFGLTSNTNVAIGIGIDGTNNSLIFGGGPLRNSSSSIDTVSFLHNTHSGLTRISNYLGTPLWQVDASGYMKSILPAYSSGTYLPAIYNSTNDRFETKDLLNDAALTGIPTAPTAAAGTPTTQIATTAFVVNTSGRQFRYTASGDGVSTTISHPHGLSSITTGSSVIIQPMNAATAGVLYATVDATNVNLTWAVAPANGTNNLEFTASIAP